MKHRITGALSALTLALGLSIAGPISPASAATPECSKYHGATMVQVHCGGSGGSRYQAVAGCQKQEWWAIGPQITWAYGDLKHRGGWPSLAVCRLGYTVFYSGIGWQA